MNKIQVFLVDDSGNYWIESYQKLECAISAFRRYIERSSCVLCDLRVCGSNESLASYRNYKFFKICGK